MSSPKPDIDIIAQAQKVDKMISSKKRVMFALLGSLLASVTSSFANDSCQAYLDNVLNVAEQYSVNKSLVKFAVKREHAYVQLLGNKRQAP